MSNATAAPVTLVLEDHKYNFYPLTLEDLEWIELAIKGRAIEAGRLSLPQDADAEERSELMRPIVEAANAINVTTAAGGKYLLSSFGVARMIHRMTKGAAEVDTCMRWLETPNIIQQIYDHVDLFGVTRAKPKSNGEVAKKKNHHKTDQKS